jgi:hypothetical protein
LPGGTSAVTMCQRRKSGLSGVPMVVRTRV